jgi:predicted deacylase
MRMWSAGNQNALSLHHAEGGIMPNKQKIFSVMVVIAAVCFSQIILAQEIKIGGVRAVPGEINSGYIKIDTEEDVDLFIPVTVINGAKQGKTLALVAGVHGFEYPPILALYRIKEMIDPAQLSGTLILVHIANLPGFQKRIIYYNPYDWKNLNRVFPGNPDGTQSQRIAHVLVEEVIKKSDALIDLHCGDGNEALIPYCYWMLTSDKEMNEISKKMVRAFGIKHIIIDDARTQDINDSRYLGNTAVLRSCPAITTESGYLGKTDEESISRNVRGILSVMRLFNMITGDPDLVKDPVWIDKYEVVYSGFNGLFHPLTKMGYYVRKGEKIGYTADYLGNVVEEFFAPFTGMILYIINTPPANKGEPVYEIGHIQEKK